MKLTEAEKRVDEVIAQQRAKGREHYGKGLEHGDGHDWNAEALQEVVDAVQYLSAENVRLREALWNVRQDVACRVGDYVFGKTDATRAQLANWKALVAQCDRALGRKP